MQEKAIPAFPKTIDVGVVNPENRIPDHDVEAITHVAADPDVNEEMRIRVRD